MVLHPAHRDCEQARNPGLGETDKRNHKCEVWRLGALGDVAPNSSRLRASSQARNTSNIIETTAQREPAMDALT